jgi:hypothetical protein
LPRHAGASESGVKPPQSKIHIEQSVDVDADKARDS